MEIVCERQGTTTRFTYPTPVRFAQRTLCCCSCLSVIYTTLCVLNTAYIYIAHVSAKSWYETHCGASWISDSSPLDVIFLSAQCAGFISISLKLFVFIFTCAWVSFLYFYTVCVEESVELCPNGDIVLHAKFVRGGDYTTTIPAHRIDTVVITENFTRCQVQFFLSVLLKDLASGESHMVLFSHSRPRLKELLSVYRVLKPQYDTSPAKHPCSHCT